MADLLTSVAQFTNLQFYAQPGPFQVKKGFLCGVFEKYLMVVAAENGVGIAVIGQALNQGNELKAALKSNAVLKSLKGRMDVKTADDGFLIKWNRITKPNAAAIRAALSEIAKIAKPFMAPYAGRCQKCGQSSTDQLVMLGGMPKIVCDSCLSKLPEQKLIAQQQYQEMQPRSLRGLAYLLAAITGLVLVYGAVIGFEGRDGSYGVKLDLIIGLAFAAFANAAFVAGAGKQTRLGMMASGFAGATGKWICSTVFFVSFITHTTQMKLSVPLIVAVALSLPQLAHSLFGGTILFYVAVGLPLFFLVSPIPEKKFPQFEFVRLGKIQSPVMVAANA